MNRILVVFLAVISCLCFASCTQTAAENSPHENGSVFGYWQIVEDGEIQSAVFFYKKDDIVYGKMVAIYDKGKIVETKSKPVERSKGFKDSPYICGLDFIYGLKPNKNGILQGKVADPDTGGIFDCEVWVEKESGKLVVRGEFLCFGKNEYWPRIETANLPKEALVNPEEAVPNIPQN